MHLFCVVEIDNKGMLGKGKTERFFLDVGRIIGNFHFSIIPLGTSGVNIRDVTKLVKIRIH